VLEQFQKDRAERREIAAVGKKVILGTDGIWPPPPNISEAVYFSGFPGCERIEIASREFSFGLHTGTVPLTDFTDYHFACRFDRRYWVDGRGLGLPPVGYDLGGVSGGPMLQPVYRDGVWGWRLLGVISKPSWPRILSVSRPCELTSSCLMGVSVTECGGFV
jgi:hypothetical protein